MKEIKKIDDVKKIFLFEGNIVLEINNFLLLQNKKYDLSDDDIGISGNYLIKSNSNQEYVFVYLDNDFILLENGWTSAYIIDKNNFLLLKFGYNEPFATSIKIVTTKSRKIIEKVGFWGIIFFNNSQIIFDDMWNKTSIHSVTLNNNQKIWQFKLPEGFTIFGKIQVIGNILMFEATKNIIHGTKIYGLDISTGKTVWEHEIDIVALNFNKNNNLCYGYGGRLYQVFNPATGEVLLSKDMSEYYEQKISPVSWNNAIADNRLWFVSNSRHEGKSKFGAINIETSEMEFVQDYRLENDGQFEKPVYHNGKLYLLDSWNKVLHVFEDE